MAGIFNPPFVDAEKSCSFKVQVCLTTPQRLSMITRQTDGSFSSPLDKISVILEQRANMKTKPWILASRISRFQMKSICCHMRTCETALIIYATLEALISNLLRKHLQNSSVNIKRANRSSIITCVQNKAWKIYHKTSVNQKCQANVSGAHISLFLTFPLR